MFTGRAVSGPEAFEVPQNQSLSLSASINGRARFDVVRVTRSVLQSVSPDRTFQTKSGQFVRRLLLWGLLWILGFVFIWPALSPLDIWGFMALLAVIVVAPPFLAGAVVDFCWWGGRGFSNEVRIKWALAALLWVLDVGPLVLLQIRVT